jgi:hypothetical protein
MRTVLDSKVIALPVRAEDRARNTVLGLAGEAKSLLDDVLAGDVDAIHQAWCLCGRAAVTAMSAGLATA